MARSGTSRNSRCAVNPFQLSAHNGAWNVLGRNHSESTSDEDEVLEDLDQYNYYSQQAYGGGAGPCPRTQLMHEDFARNAVDIRSPVRFLSPVWVPSPRHNVRRNPRQGHGGTLTPRSDKSTIFPLEPDSTPLPPLALFLGITLDQLPRQIYLYLHLRITALYWSRVSRTLQEARTSMRGIKGAAMDTARSSEHDRRLMEKGNLPYSSSNSVPWARLRALWNDFITSLIAEWSTLNIISALLLSAILSILQIESAMAWPLARFSALLSLVCAFMSLLYGCIYIIRFSTMRRTAKAAEWALKSQTRRTAIFWNVYVMLSLPSVWLGWAMIFFIVSVMSMVWQTGTTAHSVTPELTFHEALGPRIVVSCVLALGLLYLSLIAGTMKQYGDAMDEKWKARVRGWAENLKTMMKDHPAPIPVSRVPSPDYRVPSQGYRVPSQGYRVPSPDYTRSSAHVHIASPKGSPPSVDESIRLMFDIYDSSTDSSSLYQDRYCSPPSTVRSYAYGSRRLALPPSDDRVFKKREYIDSQVSRWMSQVQPNCESEEPRSATLEDDHKIEIQPVKKWLSRARQSDERPEGPNSAPSPLKDDADGVSEGVGLVLKTDSKTEPGEAGVARLDGINMETPAPLTERLSNQQSEAETSMIAAQYAPEENIDSPTPLGPSNANTEVDRGHAVPHSPLSPAKGDRLAHDNTSTTPASPDGLALWPTTMNGLQSTFSMRLVVSRVAPYPMLRTQGFSREGNLIKVLPLQGRGVSVQETSPQVSTPGVLPQVWHTFTLDVLSAWSNLCDEDGTSVKTGPGHLSWTRQEQRALLKFVALVEMWNGTMFRASRCRLIVLGVGRASGDQAEVPNRREIEFGVYMAPVDADPLVVDVEGSGEPVSFIRFDCDWVGGARMETEPDVYVRGAHGYIGAGSKPLEGV